MSPSATKEQVEQEWKTAYQEYYAELKRFNATHRLDKHAVACSIGDKVTNLSSEFRISMIITH